MPLTPQHERFCVGYVAANGNATDAYIAVYPKCKRESAHANAARLLANDRIKARIAELTAAAQKNSGITTEWALKCLKAEAEYHGDGSSHGARVSALRIACEHLGLLKEAAPHPDRPLDLTRMTDTDLEHLGSLLAPFLAPGDDPGL